MEKKIDLSRVLTRSLVLASIAASTSAQEINFTGPAVLQQNTSPACPEYTHQSDGAWPVLRNQDDTKTLVFWVNHESHRIETTNFDSTNPADWVLTDAPPAGSPYFVIGEGNRGGWNGAHTIWTYGDFDNGGSWLYNVVRASNGTLYGYYHAEDHDWPGYTGEWPADYSWIPWASQALARSTDDGITWTKLGQRVCSDKQHPPVGSGPQWGGPEACTVRYDFFNDRWVMLYGTFSWGGLRMAATADADPEGPFFKYHDGAFNEPGVTATVVNGARLGGLDSHLDGLRDVPGASHPNLHWNTYLNKWVLVFDSQYAGPHSKFFFSTSDDLITPNWSTPKLLFEEPGHQLMYPCIIGRNPDSAEIAGQNATFVYARWQTSGGGPDRQAYRVPITFNMNPNAEFSASVTATPVKRPVKFTDLSTNEPTSWLWNFGDGSTSTLQNPSHEYTAPGTYTVTLTAGNSFLPGGNVETKTGYITAGVPEADFHAQVKSGTAPLTVAFMDRSTAAPTSWSWTFGDGGTSTQPHPTRTYTTPGTYTVALTATNSHGSQTATKVAYITVGAAAAPTADFTAYPRHGGAGMKAQFTDTSTNAPSSWSWTFGDGGTSTEQNPVHQYATAGNYTVTLTATNAYGNDIESKTSQVVVVSSSLTSATSSSYDLYSEAQNGNGNWWYYEWTGSQYLPMTFNATTDAWEGTGTDAYGTNRIYQWGQYSTHHESARLYVVQHPGSVRIKTRAGAGIGRLNSKGGDGLDAFISVARASSLSQIGETVWQKYYPYDSNVLDNLDFTVDVKAGDAVVIHNDMLTGWGYDSLQVNFEIQETWGGAPPTADFSANVTTGNAPLDVTFTSTVSSDVFEYAWDFDSDGIVDSTDANPVFRFKYPGPHDVTLKVFGRYGMDVMKKSAYVRPSGTVHYQSIGPDDGYVVESAAGSGVGGSAFANVGGMWGIATGDDTGNLRAKGIVSFDTSWIPDNAVIESASLQLTYDEESILGSPYGLKPLKIDAHTGTFNTQALEPADFEVAATAPGVASENFKVQQMPPTYILGFGFNAAGAAAVNKSGLTQCRVWWNDGTNNDGVLDAMGFYPGGGAATNASKRPKLGVKFH